MTNFILKHQKRIRFTETCWIWEGAKSSSGYGNVRIDNVQHRAHRMSYLSAHGTIDKSLVVDHLCKNKLCVNPSHLELVTQKINAQRALLGTKKDFCKNGHKFTDENSYKSGKLRQCKLCKLEYSKKYYRKRST